MCGGFLWSTGEELRRSFNPAVQQRLALSGPAGVNGLQGNALTMLRPANEPPLRTYFIDYDDRIDFSAVAGHMGDLAIWRPCGPVIPGRWQMPGWMLGWIWWGDSALPPSPPNQSCPVDQQKPGVQCCPKGTAPDQTGTCKPWCPNGALDLDSQKLCALGFDNASYNPANPAAVMCIGGAAPKSGQGILGCIESSPVFNPPVCAAGYAKKAIAGGLTLCAPTAAQQACPPGEQVSPLDGQCRAFCSGGFAWPVKQCCAPGSLVSVHGQCCPPGSAVNAQTGQCQQQVTIPLCPPGASAVAALGQCIPSKTCPTGSVVDAETGACATTVEVCPGGGKADPATGQCAGLAGPPGPFPPGSPPGHSGPPGQIPCPPLWKVNTTAGGCCPPGQTPGSGGACVVDTCPAPGKSVGGKCCQPADLMPGGSCATSICGPGKTLLQNASACCPADKLYANAQGQQVCCAGKVVGGKCSPLTGEVAMPGCSPGTGDPACCGSGYAPSSNGACCAISQISTAGLCCPPGQSPNGATCGPTVTGGPPSPGGGPSGPSGGTHCCATGFIPTAGGSCCAQSQLTSMGVCCPSGQVPDPRNRARCQPLTGVPALVKAPVDPLPACAQGYVQVADGTCCDKRYVAADGRRCLPPQGTSSVQPSMPMVVPVPIPSLPPTVRPPSIERAPPPITPPPRLVEPIQPVRPTPPRIVEPPKTEPPRLETKREPPKSEPPKAETKREPPKREPPKTEAKRELPKAEPTKVETKREPVLVVPKREIPKQPATRAPPRPTNPTGTPKVQVRKRANDTKPAIR